VHCVSFLAITVLASATLISCTSPNQKGKELSSQTANPAAHIAHMRRNVPRYHLGVMLDIYRSNEVRAEHDYKNKEFKTKGIIESVAFDDDGKPYVLMTAAFGREPLPIPAKAVFVAEKELYGKFPGNPINVQCINEGLFQHKIVIMDGCIEVPDTEMPKTDGEWDIPFGS
jgi:hypothetical protein